MKSCVVCGADNWEALDMLKVKCGLCEKTKKPDCPQCRGKGEFKIALRDHEFWFTGGYLYKEPIGFRVCKECGFLTYKQRWSDDPFEDRKIHNLKLGSAPIKSAVIDANIRRAKYTHQYCSDHGIKPESILQYGCGLGYMNREFSAAMYGTEDTAAYMRYAKEINGVESPPDNLKKVDLVIINYYLQQVWNPRELLESARALLEKDLEKDNGWLYIESPLYLGDLMDVTGFGTKNFELIYHLNYRNCFTRISLENLLKSVGFKIEHEAVSLNGVRMLCRPAAPSQEIEKEDYKLVRQTLLQQSQAVACLKKGLDLANEIAKREEALKMTLRAAEIYPRFLDAWLSLSVQQDYYRDAKKLKELFTEADKHLVHKEQLYIHFGNLLKNWGDPGHETSWTRFAEDLYDRVLAINPNSVEAMVGKVSIAGIIKKNLSEMERYIARALDVSPGSYGALMNLRVMYYSFPNG